MLYSRGHQINPKGDLSSRQVSTYPKPRLGLRLDLVPSDGNGRRCWSLAGDLKERKDMVIENLHKKWRRKENLAVLQGLARDGYDEKDIARIMNIKLHQLQRLKEIEPKIERALDHSRLAADYSVEKALLKAALGYTKKEVKITTVIRYGRTAETITEETTSDVAPNVAAAQTWLYNRCPDKWKRDPQKGLLDDIDEDTSIKIEVTRKGSDKKAEAEEWQREVNKEVSVRKATESEKAEAEERKKQRKSKADADAAEVDAIVGDGDEWPDNWEELMGDDDD